MSCSEGVPISQTETKFATSLRMSPNFTCCWYYMLCTLPSILLSSSSQKLCFPNILGHGPNLWIFFSLTAMLFRINFSTQPMEEDNTKRKIIIDTEKCFVLQNWQRELEWMRLLFTAQFINSRSYLYNPDSTAVVIKLFGSWATFVFQKPFAGHKN